MNIRSINFLIILLTVASTFFIGETDILASNSGFSMTPYLEKCGGKIYSKCDSSELNQKTIFEFARKIALQENKKLMVVIGADWCPSCLYFSKMVANDPDKKELFDKVILVEINGDTNSAKDLEKKLQFSTAGYPQAFIFEGSQNEIVQWFFPSSFKNIKSLVAQLDLQEPETQIIKPSYIGQVSVALLEKPIDLIDSYGVSNFLKNPKNQSDYYINQGVAALHVFHYVDAYRSFRMAAQSDPYSIMAYVGQIISIMQIGYGEERSYFAQQALKKINGINQNGKTSKSLTAWIEFSHSFFANFASSYIKKRGENLKPILEAYQNVLAKDENNLDGHSLLTWLLINEIGYDKSKNLFEKVLNEDANNIGAIHYLLHVAEGYNDLRSATAYGEKLAILVPGSAHAQHMYGHSLPQRGQWVLALRQFKKADKIHLKWAKANQVEPQQDWHYSHNLDLMAATYMGMGDFKKALDTWERAFNFDSRAVLHSLSLFLLTKSRSEAEQKFKEVEGWGEAWASYVQFLREELELSPEKLLSENLKEVDLSAEWNFSRLIDMVKNSFQNHQELNAELLKDIQTYFTEKFKAGGFDGWSNAYLELLRLKRIAEILSMDKLLDALKPIEFAIQSGSLCGGKQEKSLTPCLPLE